MMLLGCLLACTDPAQAPAAPHPPPAPLVEPEPAPAEPEIGVELAKQLLFPEGMPEPLPRPEAATVRCLIWARYAGHAAEQAQALALYDEMAPHKPRCRAGSARDRQGVPKRS